MRLKEVKMNIFTPNVQIILYNQIMDTTPVTSDTPVTAAELREIRHATLHREKQESNDRLDAIMKAHLTWIKTQIPSASELRDLAGQPGGRSSVIIAQASPKTYRGVTSPPETAYFLGESILKMWLGTRTSVDGVPVNDPSSLPNGKTIIDLLNEEYADKGGHVFCPVWASPTRVELHMVWDEDGWKSWLQHRAMRSRKRNARRPHLPYPDPRRPRRPRDETE